MSIAVQADRLRALAQNRAPADRERLLLAIAELCDNAEIVGQLESVSVQALLNDIFMCLVVEAERDIRRRLADKLSSANWAPRALINVLALDDIEIARPIIASSPVLQDRDLIRLLVDATVEHQIEVARRPDLSCLVADAIVADGEPSVMTALAGNDTADISVDALSRMVQASRRVASLRPALVRHERLTSDLAQQLYVWVGDSLRAAIVSRFKVDPAELDRAIAQAVADSHAGRGPAEVATPLQVERVSEREEMERRLIAKLHDAGQLRPSYLLRALREGKLSLFEAALAKLGGLAPDQINMALCCDRTELLALACASVGVDRGAFPTILQLVRGLNGGRPAGREEEASRAMGAFAAHPVAAAATAFRHAVAAV